ncbi:Putative adenylate kinase [Candidatus Burarchaeum australiense]|nr:Putative adenylate kinase [Candidatus Burarchaeum australiense]
MNLLLTGVPGTGKSVLAKRLAKRLGCKLIDINAIVKEKKLWSGKDENGSLIVKLKELERELAGSIRKAGADCIVEGHLGCEMKLPVDVAVVLRTNPKMLEKRLRTRKYPQKKLIENLLAEALDYCTLKAEENYKDVREIVTSGGETKALRELEAIAKGGRGFKTGKVRWHKELEALAGRAAGF